MSGSLTLENPLTSYRFLVLLDPGFLYIPPLQAALAALTWGGGFQEVSGLGGDLEVMTYAEGGVNETVHQLGVRHSWSRISLKRGLVRDPGLWWWYMTGLTGAPGSRRDGAIMLMSRSGVPTFGFIFLGGIAAKWTGPSMNAQQGALAVEALEIAHEGLIPVPLPTPGDS